MDKTSDAYDRMGESGKIKHTWRHMYRYLLCIPVVKIFLVMTSTLSRRYESNKFRNAIKTRRCNCNRDRIQTSFKAGNSIE